MSGRGCKKTEPLIHCGSILMKYKLRGSAEHLNQLWKQTRRSDLINLTQLGSLWTEGLPAWFAMLQLFTNTAHMWWGTSRRSRWGCSVPRSLETSSAPKKTVITGKLQKPKSDGFLESFLQHAWIDSVSSNVDYVWEFCRWFSQESHRILSNSFRESDVTCFCQVKKK